MSAATPMYNHIVFFIRIRCKLIKAIYGIAGSIFEKHIKKQSLKLNQICLIPKRRLNLNYDHKNRKNQTTHTIHLEQYKTHKQK